MAHGHPQPHGHTVHQEASWEPHGPGHKVVRDKIRPVVLQRLSNDLGRRARI